MKLTLGPSGRSVVIGTRGGTPTFPNDGVSIANEVFLDDELEDFSARVMREVPMQTNDKVGDGTTTAVVLAQAILYKGEAWRGAELPQSNSTRDRREYQMMHFSEPLQAETAEASAPECCGAC